METLWIPELIKVNGVNANYNAGVSKEQFVKDHFTVGSDSFGVGKAGYFTFLIPKEGVPWQFAPVDAVTWDSGDFNRYGPGIEFERQVLRTDEGGYIYAEYPRLSLAEPLTDSQVYWGRFIHGWLHENRGYPLEQYAGPRFQAVSTGWRGFINHGDLDSGRSDGLTAVEWNYMTGERAIVPSKTSEEEDVLVEFVGIEGHPEWGILRLDGMGFTREKNPATIDQMVDAGRTTNKRVNGVVTYRPPIKSDELTSYVDLDKVWKGDDSATSLAQQIANEILDALDDGQGLYTPTADEIVEKLVAKLAEKLS